MPRLTDLAAIRARLETDRPWAAYALTDLAPGFFEFSEWHAQATGLLLLYRAFETPVLVTVGAPEAIPALLDEIRDERRMYLSVRPEILPLIKARYAVEAETPMWRMVLEPAAFQAAPPSETVRLGWADLPALEQLYADGLPVGEAPDFFSAAMLEQGVFFGVREGLALTAAAGTHSCAWTESVGTVGNVYTRRDRRGRGLAGRVTGAVAAELLHLGVRTIVLNVAQTKLAAVHVYERLGFKCYCPFYEGLASQTLA
jgi:ribosomal protein S18 acetylase RimI-like enzyme